MTKLDTAVVTSTIGRPVLEEAIQSVITQTRSAKHYVFVHGKDYWEKSKTMLDKYPQVEAIYLPNNNGGNGYGEPPVWEESYQLYDGYGMAPVFALAPFVVSEKHICFLDDDNWFEPNHIETTVGLIDRRNLDWAFSLRNIVSAEGEFICTDDCESLGYFVNPGGFQVVDNSCMVVKTEIARKYGHQWYYPIVSDRMFLKALLKAELAGGCTGKATSNYRMSPDGSGVMSADAFKQNNSYQIAQNIEFFWRKESVINQKEKKND
jgi:hypothetical protein